MPPSRPSTLSIATAAALALWAAATWAGLDAVAAPGLWTLVDRAGLGGSLAPLFAIVAAGAVTTVLVQPLAHPRRTRPWAAAIALTLLLPVLLLPVSAAMLLAALPVAMLAGVGGPVVLALLAVLTMPPFGIAALGFAVWRLARTLRLPFAVNDNQRLPIG